MNIRTTFMLGILTLVSHSACAMQLQTQQPLPTTCQANKTCSAITTKHMALIATLYSMALTDPTTMNFHQFPRLAEIKHPKKTRAQKKQEKMQKNTYARTPHKRTPQPRKR